tara:strand:+ start:4873 stop:5325 length:453 start_codon:yes stop_codon:yes gene_type:complete
MAGFDWRYNLGGGKPTLAEFQSQDTETLTKGDLMNVNAGEVDLGATNDADFAGALLGAATQSIALETSPGVVEAVDSTTWLRVIINPNAVYGTTDNSARLAGADLDLSGATGAQTIATSSNNDLRVVETKKATTDQTLVIIHPGEHYLAE